VHHRGQVLLIRQGDLPGAGRIMMLSQEAPATPAAPVRPRSLPESLLDNDFVRLRP